MITPLLFSPAISCRALRWAAVVLGLIISTRAEEPTLPEIPGVIAAGTRIELIKDGFQGTEGPIAMPDGSLLFTEILANRITKITPDGAISPFLEDTNGSNALGFNSRGELISVQITKCRLGVIWPKAKSYVEAFENQPFYRPNDLVVDRKNGIYFTDPSTTRPEQPPPPKPAVFYFNPKGKLLRVVTDVPRPNGVQLSLDEKTLYLANTAGEFVFAFDVALDGTLSHRRNFAKLTGLRETDNGPTSGADGLAVDAAGRLYVASTDGIQIFNDKGEPLGTILMPKPPQNLAFAGRDKKMLYVVGRGAVYRIAVQTPGFAGRAK